MMGKRSNFIRRPQDDYATPHAALEPLLPFLDRRKLIVEPCSGGGMLTNHLRREGFVVADISGDARSREYDPGGSSFIFVTNPPWTRKILHPIIENLSNQAETWLLLDADWMHLIAATPYLERLREIVSVGRVKWIPDSPFTGKDNAVWYRFGIPNGSPIVFHGRQA